MTLIRLSSNNVAVPECSVCILKHLQFPACGENWCLLSLRSSRTKPESMRAISHGPGVDHSPFQRGTGSTTVRYCIHTVAMNFYFGGATGLAPARPPQCWYKRHKLPQESRVRYVSRQNSVTQCS